MKNIIVVPEGLVTVNDEPYRVEPSFVFRAVLDFIVDYYPNDRIILSPANHFGTGKTEQQVASEYLRSRGVTNLIVASSYGNKYIDTRGNAYQLKQYLMAEGIWPLYNNILVCAYKHMRRAKMCFLKEGFTFLDYKLIKYKIPTSENIVPRLWYYQYPLIHSVYELIAYMRDIFLHSK